MVKVKMLITMKKFVCFFLNETKISGTSHDIPVQERDQMAPDAVQYARALRPPYHLLSFLR